MKPRLWLFLSLIFVLESNLVWSDVGNNSIDPHEFLKIDQTLSNIVTPRKVGCSNSGAIDGPETVSKVKNFRSNSCEELFSEKIPTWIDIPPTLGIYEWWPYCSTTLANEILSKPLFAPAELAPTLRKFIFSLDTCSNFPKKSGVSNRSEFNRFSSNYKDHSTVSLGQKELSKEEKRLLFKKAKNRKKDIKSFCCPKFDQECQELFEKVDVQFCEGPQCTRGTFHGFTGWYGWKLGRYFRWNKMKPTILNPKPASELPMSGDGVVLSPYKNTESSEIKMPVDIDHEFGHACSTVRWQLAVKRQTQGDLRESYGREFFDRYVEEFDSNRKLIGRDASLGCLITQDVFNVYRAVFLDLGASPDTFDCLFKVAHDSEQARFTAGNCDGGCERMALEESLADWIAVSVSESDEAFKGVIDTSCHTLKDGQHPLGLDRVACYLKTDTYKQRLQRASGCIKK